MTIVNPIFNHIVNPIKSFIENFNDIIESLKKSHNTLKDNQETLYEYHDELQKYHIHWKLIIIIYIIHT